jgi:hypothetical protein
LYGLYCSHLDFYIVGNSAEMQRALAARSLDKALRIGIAPIWRSASQFAVPTIARHAIQCHRLLIPRYQKRLNHASAGADAEVDAAKTTAQGFIVANTDTNTEATTTPKPIVSGVDANTDPITEPPETSSREVRRLPMMCSGCGAFSQTSDPEQFGYYSTKSRRINQWMHPRKKEASPEDLEEDQVVGDALKSLDPRQLEALGIDPKTMISEELAETTETGTHMPAFPIQIRRSRLIMFLFS